MSNLQSRLEALEAKRPAKSEAVFIESDYCLPYPFTEKVKISLQHFEAISPLGPDHLTQMSRESGESVEDFRQRCQKHAATQDGDVIFFQYNNRPHDIF